MLTILENAHTSKKNTAPNWKMLCSQLKWLFVEGVWQNGTIAVWQYSSTAVRHNGSMAVQQYGSTAVWHNGRMAIWEYSSMAQSHGGWEGRFHSANHNIYNLVISNLNISNLDMICKVIETARYKSTKLPIEDYQEVWWTCSNSWHSADMTRCCKNAEIWSNHHCAAAPAI